MDDRSFMYEIFRACRLCGGGGGYKMPIVTNLPLEGSDIELRHKIRECVQIEVLEDDHMPPLICELCVDKINDYFEFLEMCRLTNKTTRTKLGLPLESTLSGAADEDDNCILGTEDMHGFSNNISKTDSKPGPKSKTKAGPKSATRLSLKMESRPGPKSKEITKLGPKPGPASKKRNVTPPPEVFTRSSRSSSTIDLTVTSPGRGQKERSKPYPLEDEVPLRRLKRHTNDKDSSNEDLSSTPITRGSKDKLKHLTAEEPKRHSRHHTNDKEVKEDHNKQSKSKNKIHDNATTPKRVTRQVSDDSATENELKSIFTSNIPREKRKELKVEIDIMKEKPAVKTSKVKAETPPPAKKIKASPKSSKPTPPPSPKTVKAPTPPPPKPKVAPTYKCSVCSTTFKAQQYLNLHLQAHIVYFTSPKLACNACRSWFSSPMEVAAHHKWHEEGNSYSCRQCYDDFDTYAAFLKHIETEKCIPLYEVSDIKCDECWQMFPTLNLLNLHDCEGELGRPGGKCYRCKKSCATQKVLKKHEAACTVRPRVEGCYVDPHIYNSLQRVRVRTSRCDALLHDKVGGGHYRVAGVKDTFGLDKNCQYPYMRTLKRMPFNGMVNIGDEFFALDDDYIHWDSDSDEESGIAGKHLPTLFHLAVKKIYSKGLLGKVPKKRKKIKTDIDKAQSLLDFLIADDENTDSVSDVRKTNGLDKVSDESVSINNDSNTNEDKKDETITCLTSNKNTEKFKIKSILSEKFENEEQNGVFDSLIDSKDKIGINDLVSEEIINNSKELDSKPEDSVKI